MLNDSIKKNDNMSSQGYGICGARQSYSTGVRCHNWVEDTYGGVLAAQHRAKGTVSYGEHKSEAQEHFQQRPNAPAGSLVAGSQYDQRAKLTGLPLMLLMGHDGAHGPNSMYTSTSDIMNSAQDKKYRRPIRDGVGRAKKIRDATPQDRFSTATKTSNREAALKQNRTTGPAFRAPSGDPSRPELAEVPKERRHTNFLSTFKAGIPGLRR